MCTHVGFWFRQQSVIYNSILFVFTVFNGIVLISISAIHAQDKDVPAVVISWTLLTINIFMMIVCLIANCMINRHYNMARTTDFVSKFDNQQGPGEEELELNDTEPTDPNEPEHFHQQSIPDTKTNHPTIYHDMSGHKIPGPNPTPFPQTLSQTRPLPRPLPQTQTQIQSQAQYQIDQYGRPIQTKNTQLETFENDETHQGLEVPQTPRQSRTDEPATIQDGTETDTENAVNIGNTTGIQPTTTSPISNVVPASEVLQTLNIMN